MQRDSEGWLGYKEGLAAHCPTEPALGSLCHAGLHLSLHLFPLVQDSELPAPKKTIKAFRLRRTARVRASLLTLRRALWWVASYLRLLALLVQSGPPQPVSVTGLFLLTPLPRPEDAKDWLGR